MNLIVIEVALGLAFVFLGVSLVTSMAVETLSSWRNWRGILLREGIAWLLGGGPGRQLVTKTSFVARWMPGAELRSRVAVASLHPAEIELIRKMHAHPLLGGCEVLSNRPPSYVAAHQFALALLDCLATRAGTDRGYGNLRNHLDSLPDGFLRTRLRSILRDSDLASAQAAIERDFEEMMGRISGWYKRRTQVALFVLGSIIAVIFNIDTLRIVDTLWHDDTARKAVAGYVENYVSRCEKAAEGKECNAEAMRAVMQDASGLASLPVGWDDRAAAYYSARRTVVPEDANALVKLFRCAASQTLPLMIFGWLLTGVAASFGAPFWFDALSRLVALRITGRKPMESSAASSAGDRGQTPSNLASVAGSVGASVGERGAVTDSLDSVLSKDDIRLMQAGLGLAEADQTGELDQITRDAIRARQALTGRPQTGLADSATVRELLTQ